MLNKQTEDVICKKYVIVQKFRGFSEEKYEFVSQLAHEFKGMKEVVAYTNLENALHYDSEEAAAEALANQPEWVREGHKIKAFSKFGTYCSLRV